MITLKDIAEEAGVSEATVSLALNGKPRVAPGTRRRIQKIAKKLNYHPNASAQGLARRKTHMIGVIVPDISSPFYSELVRGLETVVGENGYQLILCTTTGRSSREETYFQLLRTQRVDGIIIMTPRGDAQIIQQIHDEGFPVVVLDRDIQVSADIVEVGADDFQGAILATEHLLKLGHTRIGFINGIPELAASRYRLRGYRFALQEHGIEPRDQWIHDGDFLEEGGYCGMREFLKLSPSLDAVFAASDLMALGAMRALREAGKRIPQDVALVGFDDIVLAPSFDPPLTTVRQPMLRMGRLAGKLLFRLIEEDEIIEYKAVLPTELVVRASCGAAPTRR